MGEATTYTLPDDAKKSKAPSSHRPLESHVPSSFKSVVSQSGYSQSIAPPASKKSLSTINETASRPPPSAAASRLEKVGVHTVYPKDPNAPPAPPLPPGPYERQFADGRAVYQPVGKPSSSATGSVMQSNMDRTMAPGSMRPSGSVMPSALDRTAVGGSYYPSSSRPPPSSARPLVVGASQSVYKMPSTIDRSMAPPPVSATASLPPPPSAPPATKSILRSSYDQEMAARQSMMSSMAPVDRAEQEKWAVQQLVKSGQCPEKWDWVRRDAELDHEGNLVREGGFQCQKGGHCVTDAVIAEGKGGMYSVRSRKWEDVDNWEGPFYWNEERQKYVKAGTGRV